jgi:O-antigen/teichoic acid export membrane protein
VAKRIAKFSLEVGNQIQTVIYPELARMWSGREGALFRSTVARTQWVLSGIGVLIILSVWLLGPTLIRLGLGPSYLPAVGLLSIQVVGVIFNLRAAPGRSAVLSMGHHRVIMGIAAIGVLVFYSVMLPGVLLHGAAGAAVAHVVLAFTNAALFEFFWRQGSKSQPLPSH